MFFSERNGYVKVRDVLQLDDLDKNTRVLLWNELKLSVIDKLTMDYNYNRDKILKLSYQIFAKYLKLEIDNTPIYLDNNSYGSGHYDVHIKTFTDDLRLIFLKSQKWFETFDILEIIIPIINDQNFNDNINSILESEKSGYRIVQNIFVPINSIMEIESIEQSVSSVNPFDSIKNHLNTALKYLSDRNAPVYRNVIKEAISSVEAACCIFLNDNSATLGKALSKLEKTVSLPTALKKTFSTLYGYSSDTSGIRHSLIEDDRIIEYEEAKFMLVTCSAFVNYLLGNMSKETSNKNA